MNIENTYKSQLDSLWLLAAKLTATKKPVEFQESIKRGYAIEKEVKDGALLFISMNPSFSKGAWNNGNSGGNVFYDIPKKGDPKQFTNDFFNAINDLYDQIKKRVTNIPSLAHHDLLFIRETKQANVQTWRKDQTLFDFFNNQLEISKNIIVDSQPKLIVVLNAGARELFEEIFGQRNPQIFCDKLGAYMYNLNNERTTPVLFSGMLSGRHALDLGSKESLKWHIEHILKNIP